MDTIKDTDHFFIKKNEPNTTRTTKLKAQSNTNGTSSIVSPKGTLCSYDLSPKLTSTAGNNLDFKFESFDEVVKNRSFEIKSTKSSFEGQDVALVIFFDVTERNLIAKLNDENEFKNNLLASFSHELKTPLNSSTLMIQNALSTPDLSEETQMYLKSSLINSKRLELTISDILDFCLVNSRKFALNIEKFNIKGVLNELLELVSICATSKSLEIKSELEIQESVLSRIKSDRKRVLQILYNLIGNAIKFTSSGLIKLVVRNDPLNDGCIEFVVQDTGIGMSNIEQEKLKNHMVKANFGQKVAEGSSGAGIGLFISNQIAISLGKEISFTSKCGVGSEFKFSIINYNHLHNSIYEDSDPDTNQSNVLKFHDNVIMGIDDSDEIFIESPLRSKILDFSEKLQRFSWGGINYDSKVSTKNTLCPGSLDSLECKHAEVFIADDDPFNILSLKTITKKLGHMTQDSFNGQELLDKLKAVLLEKQHCKGCKAAKLIILDCNMPVMDGYTCVKLLKQMMSRGEIPVIPVVACTAYVHEDEKKYCDKYGFDHLLPKPINVNKLKALFDKYLST